MVEESLKRANDNLIYQDVKKPLTRGSSSHKGAPTAANDELQTKILRELEYLKANPSVIQKPGTSSSEVFKLRKDREELLIENKKLKGLVSNNY